MKQTFKKVLFMATMLVMLLGMTCVAHAAEKKTEVKTVEMGYLNKQTHCGDYYFKWNKKNWNIYMGTSKDNIKKKTPLPEKFVVAGKKAYYLNCEGKKLTVMSYNLKSYKTKEEKLITSKVDEDYDYFEIKGGSGKYFYFTRKNNEDRDNCRYTSYCFNVDSKNYKTISKSREVLTAKNGMMVTTKRKESYIKPMVLSIHKIKSDGTFGKGKEITKLGYCPTIIGSKLYYAYYPKKWDHGGSKLTYVEIKCCNLDGTHTKTLAKADGMKAKDTKGKPISGDLEAERITSKYAYFNILFNSNTVKFIYESKKFIRL